jgi:hypothetical protein
VALAEEADETMWKERYEALQVEIGKHQHEAGTLLGEHTVPSLPKDSGKKAEWMTAAREIETGYIALWEFLNHWARQGEQDGGKEEQPEEQQVQASAE